MSTQSLSDSPDFNTLQMSPNMINVRQTLQESQVEKNSRYWDSSLFLIKNKTKTEKQSQEKCVRDILSTISKADEFRKGNLFIEDKEKLFCFV